MGEETIEGLKRRLAQLESRNDWLESYLASIDELCLRFGFPQGLKGFIQVTEELIRDHFSRGGSSSE